MPSDTSTLHGRIGRRALHLGALALPLILAVGCSEPEPLAMTDLVREGGAYLHPVTREPYSGPVFAAYLGFAFIGAFSMGALFGVL